jgi:hypothetical protein
MDKEYIINEIKRTAKDNAGLPLGHRRFFQETGIRESDWKGRFWVRWGDAVQDAGYAPNAYQTAYGEDELIEHLANLARELGHFPISAELRMKATQDKGFPSDSIWRSRFGSKASMVKRVLDYCTSHPDLADVAELCAAVANATGSPPSRRVGKDETNFGFVYLLRSGKHYKIGRSNAVGRRQYELAIQLPEKVQKVHDIRTDDPVGIEAYWHNRFAARRKNGEWFELAAADIAAFKRRKFM